MVGISWLPGFGSKRVRVSNETNTAGASHPSSSQSLPQLLSGKQTTASTISPESSNSDVSTLTLGNSDSDIDDDKAPNGLVVYTPIKLIPACYLVHGCVKGKGKAGDISNLPLAAQRCGTMRACHQGIIVPTFKAPTIRTDPIEDELKVWLLTWSPNPRFLPRKLDIVKQSRFTSAMLLSTLDLAVTKIRAEKAHILGLIEYAAREPYGLEIPFDDTPISPYRDLDPSKFAKAPRKELEQELIIVSHLLDSLRTKAAKINRKIREEKIAAAKEGNWSEVQDLLRMDVVGVQWVRKNCKV